MEVADQVSERFLRSLKNQFYADREKFFWQERTLLLQAISWPARWLDERGVRLNAKDYTRILTTIIRTINQHGDLKSIRSFGRYLLHSVQEHMRHHGEEYYNMGIRTRNAIDDVLYGLSKSKKQIAQDNTVPVLAEVHRLVASKGGRKKQSPPKPSPEPDLFAR